MAPSRSPIRLSKSEALSFATSWNWEKKTMNKYEIIIFWSEDDGSFIAEVPELAGCMADGKTYHEALSNTEVIIQEWIETAKELGRPIPKPGGRLKYA